jgi:hypothetical protein
MELTGIGKPIGIEFFQINVAIVIRMLLGSLTSYGIVTSLIVAGL